MLKQLCLISIFIAVMSLGACSLSETKQNPPTNGQTQPISGNIYGPGFAFDSLANTRIGGPFGTVASYRIKPNYQGKLESIKIYLVQGSGYSGGNGGTLKVSLQEDDGSNAHNPNGKILATALISDTLSPTFPVLSFDTAVNLKAQQTYHLVFTNIDPNPQNNYISINTMYYRRLESPRQPALEDNSWDVLIGESPDGGNRQASSWRIRELNKGQVYTPILELQYTDGHAEGMGYMEVWVNNPKPISGDASVRQRFTVSNSDKAISKLSLRARHVSGNDDLHVHLSQQDGTILAQADIPSNTLSQDNASWATVEFPETHTLEQGETYFLTLISPSSSTYEAYPIRKGSDYGYHPNTYFNDGYAQFNDGSGWIGWDQWGKQDERSGDLQFYFELSEQADVVSNTSR